MTTPLHAFMNTKAADLGGGIKHVDLNLLHVAFRNQVTCSSEWQLHLVLIVELSLT